MRAVRVCNSSWFSWACAKTSSCELARPPAEPEFAGASGGVPAQPAHSSHAQPAARKRVEKPAVENGGKSMGRIIFKASGSCKIHPPGARRSLLLRALRHHLPLFGGLPDPHFVLHSQQGTGMAR